ncbi:MAG TPA: hypothetical protein VHT05_12845 [Candidatus Elarobacter sp.]|jgi:hypothetical protein|nr:hypothetical protein [Candidatus Elarobacter sp.]
MRVLDRTSIALSAATFAGSAAAAYGAVALHVSALVPWLVVLGASAAFGWARRRCDLRDVFFPSVLIAYAGFLGVAVMRASSIELVRRERPPYVLAAQGPLSDMWPVLLVGGLVIAFMVTAMVTLPISMFAPRPPERTAADDALLDYIHTHTARD